MARAWSQDRVIAYPAPRCLAVLPDGKQPVSGLARPPRSCGFAGAARPAAVRRKQGQPRCSKLDPHRGCFLGLIAETPDLTIRELPERLLVERFFNKIKHYRAVATRYGKRDDNFLATITIASIRIWLRFRASGCQLESNAVHKSG
jgi:hypothetical protein